MKGRSIYFVAIFLILLGCQAASPDANEGPKLEILAEAGSMPSGEWNYLPYPAHYGKIGKDHVLLVSKAPQIGKSRSISPIGMLTVSVGENSENWIIANDAHPDYAISGLSDINDLMTSHNGIKSTLERWITNRSKVGQIMLKGWAEAPVSTLNDNQ